MTPAETLTFARFTQSPDCGYPLVYSFTLDTGFDLPAIISADSKKRTVTVSSDNPSDEGNYIVRVTAATPPEYKHTKLTATFDIAVSLQFDCA